MGKFTKILSAVAGITIGSAALADPQICQYTGNLTFGQPGFQFTERVTVKVSDETAVYFDPQWNAPHYRMEDHSVAFLNDDVDSIHVMFDPWGDQLRVVDSAFKNKPRNMQYHHPVRSLTSWYDTYWVTPNRGTPETQFQINGRFNVDSTPVFRSSNAIVHHISVDYNVGGNGAREGYLVQIYDPNMQQWITSAMRFSDFNAFRARLEGWDNMLRAQTSRAATLALGSIGGASALYIGGDVDRTLASLAALGLIFRDCYNGRNEYVAAREALDGVRGYMSGRYQSWNSNQQIASYITNFDLANMSSLQILQYLERAGFSDALDDGSPV